MVLTSEWSRSRYWFSRFLHNRHVRLRPAGRDCPSPFGDLASAWRDWAAHRRASLSHQTAWLVSAAVHRCAHDPAYIQSLRLISREQAYHADLLGTPPSPSRSRSSMLTSVRRLLGMRFELSVLLLDDLADLATYDLLADALTPGPLRDACRQIAHDRRMHAMFHAERLTVEFADFNFIRRNLRRLRLRAMFAAAVARVAVRHAALFRAAGIRRTMLIGYAWSLFRSLLERMVPYRRDALLAMLLDQRTDPYAEPRELGGR